jgi:pantoate--beta-alanine ligase
MSSRNANLSAEERTRALALHEALEALADTVAGGVHDPQAARAPALAALAKAGVEPEYLEIVDKHTLAPVSRIDGEALALIAARIGATRLIDNYTIKDGST